MRPLLRGIEPFALAMPPTIDRLHHTDAANLGPTASHSEKIIAYLLLRQSAFAVAGGGDDF